MVSPAEPLFAESLIAEMVSSPLSRSRSTNRRPFAPEPLASPLGSEAMTSEIRRLGVADAAAFRAIRLEGLERCPCAFRHGLDEEIDLPLDAFAARLEDEVVFGAFGDGALAGVAGFRRPPYARKAHKGELWGVYVRPTRRNDGVGTALIEAVIAHARGEVEQLHAAVVLEALPARRLYQRLGFVPYGIEPGGLKVGGRRFDQELLARLF
jgi:GNAT superfamily N-acetyltransferase